MRVDREWENCEKREDSLRCEEGVQEKKVERVKIKNRIKKKEHRKEYVWREGWAASRLIKSSGESTVIGRYIYVRGSERRLWRRRDQQVLSSGPLCPRTSALPQTHTETYAPTHTHAHRHTLTHAQESTNSRRKGRRQLHDTFDRFMLHRMGFNLIWRRTQPPPRLYILIYQSWFWRPPGWPERSSLKFLFPGKTRVGLNGELKKKRIGKMFGEDHWVNHE